MYEHTDINRDGERDLCRQILVIAIKDAISEDEAGKYSRRNRAAAIRWLAAEDDNSPFSFNNIISYIFGEEIDPEPFRDKILDIINKGTISGVKNLEKIFGISEGDL